MTWDSGPMLTPSHDHTVYGDDEFAQSMERRQQAAEALAAQFLANADAGDDAANTDMVAEMRRRMREQAATE